MKDQLHPTARLLTYATMASMLLAACGDIDASSNGQIESNNDPRPELSDSGIRFVMDEGVVDFALDSFVGLSSVELAGFHISDEFITYPDPGDDNNIITLKLVSRDGGNDGFEWTMAQFDWVADDESNKESFGQKVLVGIKSVSGETKVLALEPVSADNFMAVLQSSEVSGTEFPEGFVNKWKEDLRLGENIHVFQIPIEMKPGELPGADNVQQSFVVATITEEGKATLTKIDLVTGKISDFIPPASDDLPIPTPTDVPKTIVERLLESDPGLSVVQAAEAPVPVDEPAVEPVAEVAEAAEEVEMRVVGSPAMIFSQEHLDFLLDSARASGDGEINPEWLEFYGIQELGSSDLGIEIASSLSAEEFRETLGFNDILVSNGLRESSVPDSFKTPLLTYIATILNSVEEAESGRSYSYTYFNLFGSFSRGDAREVTLPSGEMFDLAEGYKLDIVSVAEAETDESFNLELPDQGDARYFWKIDVVSGQLVATIAIENLDVWEATYLYSGRNSAVTAAIFYPFWSVFDSIATGGAELPENNLGLHQAGRGESFTTNPSSRAIHGRWLGFWESLTAHGQIFDVR